MKKSVKSSIIGSLTTLLTLGGVVNIANADTQQVKSGDTLSGIAQENNTTVANLLAANKIANPNLIYIGQDININAKNNTPAKTVTVPTSVTVKAGDTLSGIAQQFHLTVSGLAAANNLSNPNDLMVGQKLVLKEAPVQQQAPKAPVQQQAQQAPVQQQAQQAPAQQQAQQAPAQQQVPPVAAATSRTNTSYAAKAAANVAPTQTATTTTSASSAAAQAAQYARQFVGNSSYVWGASNVAGHQFDCSGLVMAAFQSVGISLPHQSGAQAAMTTRISASQAQAGDLLFWANASGDVYHVAISLGNGNFVNALDPQSGVVYGGMGIAPSFAGRVN
ncbi:C40 family peptidase [Periweissella ghanensis]|uniref:Peptidoglycan endopeptidase n=1 Tax=Periweissella ghanensis TaxID=467997 RepID=A0ABN8BMY6_9LACO|nr:C40 family peptidase [Periweissella ghanensis]MCM0599990.1 LysM peptidoglycan-binding domain-containing protein [Periweissella ghanensis]CAH0418211.1 hypothetical protein WGH24286_00627 [Periweissella ghanensis]